jgi:hypothetical protein
MKKLLTLIASLLIFCAVHAQTEYPKFETDSLGNKLVVLTLEQAQALDNNTDLLQMFEKLDGQIGAYDSVCLQVVNQKDSVIAKQSVQINKLKESQLVKDSSISELQKKINLQTGLISSYLQTIKNKDTEIALHIQEIRKVQKNYFIGGGISGIVISALLFAFFHK